jgi:hypothetical protein
MRKPANYEEFVNSTRLKSELNPFKSYGYDLQVFEDDFRFTLALPPGVIIEDDFEGLYRRRPLYEQLEEGEIFNWLCEVHRAIMEEQNQAAVDS